ncbi:hypothetical protein [Frigoribacterium sp. UYMn621]|uniref:hypothetical protein n=1 Tax=Frigoribacterium sp. UYMn621 TaxID=3156343 RepID=UPI0033916A52
MTNQTTPTAAEDLFRGELMKAHRDLTDAGLTVAASTDLEGTPLPVPARVTRQDLEAGSARSIPIRLGIGGKTSTPSGALYPLVVELPIDGAHTAGDALRQAVERASCEPLLQRLGRGWSEDTGRGATQYWVAVGCASDEVFRELILSLPSRTATQAGEISAAIRFGASVMTSPSPTTAGSSKHIAVIAGTRGELTPITAFELLGLSTIVDELSDSRDRHAKGIHDVRSHTTQVNAVRDMINRQTPTADVARALTENGWVEGESDGFRTVFTLPPVEAADDRDAAPERSGELLHSTATFIANPGANPETFRAFDIIAQNTRHGGSAEATAEWLVSEGHVHLSIEYLAARGERVLVEENQPTDLIIRAFTEAVRAARSANDVSMPLCFSYQVGGVHVDLLSLLPSGIVKTWDDRNASTLLLTVAQLVATHENKDGTKKVTYRHAIPPAIVMGVLSALGSSAVLPPVEHLATEPILTGAGAIASAPGYDRAARAIVAIPLRERKKWAAEYSTPARPTLAEAQAAYEFLDLELIDSFCHATPVDRARHMAFLLTAVCRSAITGSPGWLATATNRGTGKSLFLLSGRVLAQGHPGCQSFRSAEAADIETEKALATLAFSHGRFLHCDEVKRGSGLGGDTITKATTSVDGEFVVRKLGQSVAIPVSGVIPTAAGNNVYLEGDAGRRFITCAFQWEGKGSVLMRDGFRHKNLIHYIVENRPALISAVHTIVLYGMQQGPAHSIPPYSFTHDWAAVILGAMSHLKTASGVDAHTLAMSTWLASVDATDTLSEDNGELWHALYEATQGEPFDIGHFRTIATLPAAKGGESVFLPDDLRGLHFESGEVANRAYGKHFRSLRGTSIPYEGDIFRVQVVAQSEKSKRSRKWRFEKLDTDGRPITRPSAAEPAPAPGSEFVFE